MLKVQKVTRRIGNFSLTDISLDVDKGNYVIILGPTGCGKTMLLETIAGIGRVDSGTIQIAGRDVSNVPTEKRNIGFVYQRSMLFPHHTVEGNIRWGMRLRKIPADEQRRRIDKLAGILGIGPLLGRDVRNLSGGESQKVALARALAIEPPILLLDEPLAPLDPPAREAMRGEILKIHRELDTTILHVTHDQVTARVLGKKVGVMDNGRIRQFGTADDIFERPNSEFVARFIGIENVYRGVARTAAEGSEITAGGIMLRSRSTLSGGVGLCISPEMIQLAPGKQLPNLLDGCVREVADRGSVFRVSIDVKGVPFTAHVSRCEYELNRFGIGASVKFGFDADKVHCFKLDGA